MKNLDVMLSRPGSYLIVGARIFIFAEVDAAGRCFQLEPHSGAWARDGELWPGGWHVEAVASIHGPFARVAREPSETS